MASAAMSISLDEYIQQNPQLIKHHGKTNRPKNPQHFPSQQWRLGRNGPRPLKRLGRYGPRPLTHERTHHNPGNNDGLPRLVRKRLAQLPLTSVFHRLGFNPTFTLARQRVRQARHHFWMRQQPYYQTSVPSFPMGRRPMFRRSNYYQRPWQQRRPNWQKPIHFHQPFLRQQNNNFRNEELIKAERRRVQEVKLRNIQNEYSFAANQGAYREYPSHQQMHSRPTLPDDSFAEEYPIPSDQYRSNIPPDRAPSPEGSIINAMMGRSNRAHSFSQNNPFASNNPLTQPARGHMGMGQTNTGNPFLSNFRPTPTTSGVSIHQRISGGAYSASMMT